MNCAAYREQIVATLSQQLTADYGKGFAKSNLVQMIQLAELFTDRKVGEKLVDVLSWSHFVEVLPLKDTMEREFYANMCHACRWSVRDQRQKIHRAHSRT